MSTLNKRAAAEIRRFDMIELAKAGYSERQIARSLEVSQPYVHTELKKMLEKMAKDHEGSADKVRALQMQRYNQLLSAYWHDAIGSKEKKPDLKTGELLLKVLEKINLINGIIPDRPLINVDNRSIQFDAGDLSFSIEKASSRQLEGQSIDGTSTELID